MHNIDRALFEMEQESSGEQEGGPYESQELELASELLEVSSEAELDRFLGKLLSSAVSAGKSFLSSDAGRAVGGLLKGAAKKALPQVGRAVGDFVAPGVGGKLGSQAGTAVGGMLGLELEGLSGEDRELEVARAFVRFADETARTAASAPPSVPPAAAASRAAMAAAQRNAPGLVPLIERLTPPGQNSQGSRRTSGKWVRRGSSIVLLNT